MDQEICILTVVDNGEAGEESYAVGKGGVTRIEACTKAGMYADIPYIRVWKGDTLLAEFCQHNVVGVYFTTRWEQGA